ncbi:Receptor-like cytosolic serine/threonine-protein kinase [Nymphaea thermarum]|nr:Receptor-like cytosolic serine/threonine-protein kinase [Nymphaea thermarum]
MQKRSASIKEGDGDTFSSCRSGSRTEVFSPRGVLEECLRSMEYDTTSSKTSTSYFSESRAHGNITHWRNLLRHVLKQRPMRRLSTFPPLGVPKMSRKGSISSSLSSKGNMVDASDICRLKPTWRNFSLAELQSATNNFCAENLIGKGGYAEVYKGTLHDGELIAVKRLIKGTADERTADFLSELGIIAHINHKNAARLVGFSVEGGMHLVLQLSAHGSLASLLYGTKELLSWEIRYKIALGAAKGLRYLHEGCQRRIIHRDIKASNILLTEDFEPQISDFGLAKWLPDQWTHHIVSRFEGTFGYLAPEYFMHGIVDEKTDVYALGVLLLELITGRRAIDASKKSLVLWAKPLLDASNIEALADPCLGGLYDPNEMNHMVVRLLKGEDNSVNLQRSVLSRTYSEGLFDVEEYDATMYLNDMNRHRELALQF